MRIRHTAPLAVLAAFTALVPAPCQEAVQPATRATSAAGATFVLEPGTVQLGELIDHVAKFLDYNLLYSETEVTNANQNGIRLTRRTEVDRDGCWQLFNSLLYHKGFAILAMDADRGFYDIVSMQGPRAREIAATAMFVRVADVESYAQLKAIPILTSVPLHNVNATIATNALRPFFSNPGPTTGALTVGNVGNSSDMLLQGYGPQVAAACRLLRLIDSGGDGETPVVQVVALEHAAVADVVARLEETLCPSQAMMQSGLAPSPPLRAVANPALNAVILTGTTTQLTAALDLIAKLDLPARTPSVTGEDVHRRLQQIEERLRRLEGRPTGGQQVR